MRNSINLTSQSFGHLQVLNRARMANGKAGWACKCVCGSIVIRPASELKLGRHKSCGCLRYANVAQALTTHGKTKTVEYRTWTAMIMRCTNPNHVGWKRYGQRGIRICDRWRKSFEAFLADMGKRPPEAHSIDRIDNNGNYEPGNCRWATRSEQMLNRQPLSQETKDKIRATLLAKGNKTRNH